VSGGLDHHPTGLMAEFLLLLMLVIAEEGYCMRKAGKLRNSQFIDTTIQSYELDVLGTVAANPPTNTRPRQN